MKYIEENEWYQNNRNSKILCLIKILDPNIVFIKIVENIEIFSNGCDNVEGLPSLYNIHIKHLW